MVDETFNNTPNLLVYFMKRVKDSLAFPNHMYSVTVVLVIILVKVFM